MKNSSHEDKAYAKQTRTVLGVFIVALLLGGCLRHFWWPHLNFIAKVMIWIGAVIFFFFVYGGLMLREEAGGRMFRGGDDHTGRGVAMGVLSTILTIVTILIFTVGFLASAVFL